KPARNGSRPPARNSPADVVDGNTNGSGTNRIDEHEKEERGEREHAENFECGGDEQRINRSEPRRRAGVFQKWIAKAFAGDQRVRDAPGFLFEWSGSQRLVWNFACLVPGKGQSRAQRHG